MRSDGVVNGVGLVALYRWQQSALMLICGVWKRCAMLITIAQMCLIK